MILPLPKPGPALSGRAALRVPGASPADVFFTIAACELLWLCITGPCGLMLVSGSRPMCGAIVDYVRFRRENGYELHGRMPVAVWRHW